MKTLKKFQKQFVYIFNENFRKEGCENVEGILRKFSK